LLIAQNHIKRQLIHQWASCTPEKNNRPFTSHAYKQCAQCTRWRRQTQFQSWQEILDLVLRTDLTFLPSIVGNLRSSNWSCSLDQTVTPITQLTMCGIACGANKGSQQLSQLELHTA